MIKTGLKFDAALPDPYNAVNWREAYRSEKSDKPRNASYQAPGGETVNFIQESFKFSGGQALDTAEYPFGGLWSVERLNEKPQALTVTGFLRGIDYINRRNTLIEALRVRTDDENPGFIDLPFWGRFPVVVQSYDIDEKTQDQGQCGISITFTRAGATVNERFTSLSNAKTQMDNAAANLKSAAIGDFVKKLNNLIDIQTLMAGFGKIKSILASIVGNIQAAQTTLNVITAEINGITSLIAQGIRSPGEFASALFNAAASIVAGLSEIKNSVESYTNLSEGSASAYSPPQSNSEKKAVLLFLSAKKYKIDVPAATVAQQNTKSAMENLYKTAALFAASQIITEMDISYQKTSTYWNLLQELELSIDKEDSAVYTSVEDLRIAISIFLSSRTLNTEAIKQFPAPLPLLYIAQYLGCDEAKLRELNSIADSFIVTGDVVYV
ncbi:MAG: DNA circularization N-terminal domain-containing protein [Treponema sp.]|jgi:prophage DNA circulation protein|nr:DNA circularization N-terminal domain-containing protein [Treponema sp.]